MKYMCGGVRGWLNVLAVSGVYIAAVVGAGFASGQEIVSFFVKYGNISIIAAAAASTFFGIALYTLLEYCRRNGISDFTDYLKYSAGEKAAGFLDILTSIFMLCVFGAMTACAGILISEISGMSAGVCVLAANVICFFCFCFDIRGFTVINSLLSPIIVFGIIGVCLYILFFREMSAFAGGAEKLCDNVVISSLGYTSYNLLTAAAIAVNMSGITRNKKQTAAAGVISGIFFFVMIALLWTVIKIYYGKIELGAIPMLTIVSREGRTAGLIYTAVLSASTLTTAFSSGFAAVRRAGRIMPVNRYMCALIVCAAGFFLSGFGFSALVEKVYRICGIAGIALLVIVMRDYFRLLISSGKAGKNLKSCDN